MIRKIKEYIKFIISIRRYIISILKDITQIRSALNINDGDIHVDEKTPRIDCLKIHPKPILEGQGGHIWNSTIFDGRLVSKNIIYYCAQTTYNTKSGLVLGRAEWDGTRYRCDDRPCIYKTEETYGIDIPTFFIFKGKIICIYFDNYGLGRISDNRNRNLVICRSDDGKTFEKSILISPLRDYIYPKMGLPFIENVAGKLYITVRAKTLGRHIVSRAKFDLKTGMTKEWQHIDMPRNTINISTLTLGDVVHVFNGSTTAGGFYVTTLDAKTFTKISDYMLVDQNTNPWGWDMRKICASPLVEGDDLMLTYLSNFKVGLATMDLNNLPSGNKIP